MTRGSQFGPITRLLVWIVGASVAFWGLAAVAMLVYTKDARVATTHELEIPAGAGEEIARGENPLQIPATWSFYGGDQLVLVNNDSVDHWLGSYFVPAGGVANHRLQPSIVGSLSCSLHPAGEIVIEVEPRTFSLGHTLVPTLLLGPLLGLIGAGLQRLVGLLRDDGSGSTETDGAQRPSSQVQA